MFSLQKLLGKEDKFYDLLEAAARESRSSVQGLGRFLDNPDQLRPLEDILVAGRKGPKIADQISETLCSTFVTSLDREDIEALSVALRKIPKAIEKIAERILLAPDFLRGVDLTRHVALLDKATETVVAMIAAVREGADFDGVKAENDKLRVIEGEADKLIVNHLRNLYSGEHDAIKVVFLKDIFELLEKVANRCRDAGNVVNQIVLKNS